MPKAIDEKFMRRALALAEKAAGYTGPNPMVGAVIVNSGKIVSEGYHKRCGEDHAEIVALKKLVGIAKGMTMYVSLEPCHHYGRTPPCVDAVIKSGIKKVIVAMTDPNPLTKGKSILKMRRAGIDVVVGVMEEEARHLNEIFIKNMTDKMPFVAVKFAQTLDGKIATSSGESKWITSEEARQYAYRERNLYDAIMVGRRTVEVDDPRLNAENPQKKIKKIIADSRLQISLKSKLFHETNMADIYIAISEKASSKRVKDFRSLGVNIITCGTKDDRLIIKPLFHQFYKLGISSILVEGGGQLVGGVLQEKLADKVYAYVAPRIIGDEKAVNSVSGLRPLRLGDAVKIEGIKIKKFETDILLEGYVFRHSRRKR